MQILVLHPGALGDVILSLPALSLLRVHFPTAEVTCAANLDFSAVVCQGYADRFLSLSTLPLHRLHGNEPLTAEELHFWRSYDLIHSWTGSGDPEFARKLGAANPAAVIASWKPANDEVRHVSEIFVDSLLPRKNWGLSQAPRDKPDFSKDLSGRAWTVPNFFSEAPRPKIWLSEIDRQSGEEWLGKTRQTAGGPFVALHPGAGSPAKRWPQERFCALAREISRSLTRNLVIIEGPAESGLSRLIGRELPDVNLRFAKNLPLGCLAGALAGCQAFVGNDSGISHLAAALGVPSLVLFGPTSPAHWSPRGGNVTILYDSGGCRACQGKDSAHICLENISVQACLSALQNRLSAMHL